MTFSKIGIFYFNVYVEQNQSAKTRSFLQILCNKKFKLELFDFSIRIKKEGVHGPRTWFNGCSLKCFGKSYASLCMIIVDWNFVCRLYQLILKVSLLVSYPCQLYISVYLYVKTFFSKFSQNFSGKLFK